MTRKIDHKKWGIFCGPKLENDGLFLKNDGLTPKMTAYLQKRQLISKWPQKMGHLLWSNENDGLFPKMADGPQKCSGLGSWLVIIWLPTATQMAFIGFEVEDDMWSGLQRPDTANKPLDTRCIHLVFSGHCHRPRLVCEFVLPWFGFLLKELVRPLSRIIAEKMLWFLWCFCGQNMVFRNPLL